MSLELTRDQLKQPISQDDRTKISDLQDAINHDSVDVYLRNNFTEQQLLQICRICRIEPKRINKESMIKLLIHKVVNKNQNSKVAQHVATYEYRRVGDA